MNLLNRDYDKYLSGKETLQLAAHKSPVYTFLNFWFKFFFGFIFFGIIFVMKHKINLFILNSFADLSPSIISIFNTALIWTAVLYLIMISTSYLRLRAFTYLLTDQSLYIVSGLLSKKSIHIPYDQVTDTEVDQSFFDKLIYNAGTLKVNTSGNPAFINSGTHELDMAYEGMLTKIEHPVKFKNIISKHL